MNHADKDNKHVLCGGFFVIRNQFETTTNTRICCTISRISYANWLAACFTHQTVFDRRSAVI